MSDLSYPIGVWSNPGSLSSEARSRAIDVIEKTPASLRAAVDGLEDSQLDTPYRPGGWTVRQVVHHVPDSHVNSYIRFKLGITEDKLTITTYRQDEWANLPDMQEPIEGSLRLLEALHARWVLVLRNFADEDWEREVFHPEIGMMRLDALLSLYEWHGPHHVAHITRLREREGW